MKQLAPDKLLIEAPYRRGRQPARVVPIVPDGMNALQNLEQVFTEWRNEIIIDPGNQGKGFPGY